MDHALLSRRPHRTGPQLQICANITLPLARVHEACGRARRTFAMMVAAQTKGHVYWISPAWNPDQLNPEGMHRFVDPARFTHLSPTRPEDVLWCMEEILRSGAVPLVVADIPGLPGLTQVRRMHLAAERGLEEDICQPLGLLLTPGDGGAQGVESRWRMQPEHSETREMWLLERLRARTEPQKHWHMIHTKTNGRTGFTPAPETGSLDQTGSLEEVAFDALTDVVVTGGQQHSGGGEHQVKLGALHETLPGI